MIYATLVVGGAFALYLLPIELSPTVEFPRLSVSTFWGNTSPETVEMFLTAPVEEIANTIRGVRKVRSSSEEGGSSVEIEFEQKTDMNFARLELSEKLSAFAETLPAGASAPVIQHYVPKDFRDLQGFLSYSISGNRPASELRALAEENVAPSLLAIKGVADVEVYGGERREISIEMDPTRMAALGLTPDQVALRLRESRYGAPVGVLQTHEGRVVVSIGNAEVSLRDIASVIVVGGEDSVRVRIADIARTEDGFSQPGSFYRVNGKPSVTLVIKKEPHVNTLRLADAVFREIDRFPRRLPSDVALAKESDKSEQLREELDRLYQQILFSLLCIFLVLVLFLRNFRAPLLILSSILFSLAGTFLVFWIFKIELNLLTLAGLVLGFGRLVDDSIVVLENAQRHLNSSEGGRAASIAAAIREIAVPVVASTLTTVGALLPLYFLPQDLKPYFLEFAFAVGISLLMSLLVSFTLIPIAAHRLYLQSDRFAFVQRFGDAGMRAYRTLLGAVLRRKKLAIALAIWLFGLPVWLLPERTESDNWFSSFYNATLGSGAYRDLRPYIDYGLGGSSHLFFTKVTKGEVWEWGKETYLIISVRFPQGTEIERYNRIALAAEKEVLGFTQGIRKVTTRVMSDYAVVRVDIADSAVNTALPFVLKNKLVLFAAQTGGAEVSVSGFGPGFFSGGGTSSGFYIKVLGYNYNKVKELAQEFREAIEQNPRIDEVDIDKSFGLYDKTYELVVAVRRDAIAGSGLSVVEVLRAIRMYTAGDLDENEIELRGERIRCSLKFAGYKEFSTDKLEQAVIANSRGERVRLGDLVTIEERRVQSQILRENQQYERLISFDYKGPYGYGDKFIDATIKSIPLPSGYSFDRSFSFFHFSEESQQAMLWIAFFALIIVFMITASLYESFVKPFVIILSVPFSLIGLFLAFYLTDTPFGRGGYASVILLVGIVVTNSILLVDYIARVHKSQTDKTEYIIQAASVRLRPILMTALTTIAGVVPLLLMGDRTSLWYSLALGTIGGLVSSTLLTLFLVPAVFELMSRSRPEA